VRQHCVSDNERGKKRSMKTREGLSSLRGRTHTHTFPLTQAAGVLCRLILDLAQRDGKSKQTTAGPTHYAILLP
jgi:hypothetical protein